jgi:hypothetical protein
MIVSVCDLCLIMLIINICDCRVCELISERDMCERVIHNFYFLYVFDKWLKIREKGKKLTNFNLH